MLMRSGEKETDCLDKERRHGSRLSLASKNHTLHRFSDPEFHQHNDSSLTNTAEVKGLLALLNHATCDEEDVVLVQTGLDGFNVLEGGVDCCQLVGKLVLFAGAFPQFLVVISTNLPSFSLSIPYQ